MMLKTTNIKPIFILIYLIDTCLIFIFNFSTLNAINTLKLIDVFKLS